MAFVQVKNTLQTWKLAAFIVAFFSPFFSHSINIPSDFSFDGLAFKLPFLDTTKHYTCNILGVDMGISSSALSCANRLSAAVAITSPSSCGFRLTRTGTVTELSVRLYYQIGTIRESGHCGTVSAGAYAQLINPVENSTYRCPPSDDATFDVHHYPDNTPNGNCYRSSDIQRLIDGLENDSKNDDKCKALILDSGNNSAESLCYSPPYSGISCDVDKVTFGDTSYYSGSGSVDGGCINSDKPDFDGSGIGDSKDNCIYSNNTNYCAANRDKHCSTIQGSSICDDGCIDDGTTVFCDVGLHPDVGEGDSNYFDSNGTCSVVGASASRGFCNEMGGTWDETQDYQETSCPTGTGNCSVASAGLCRACFDAGGTWTPDDNALHSDETKASLETGALIKSTNTKLDSIEHGQRMTMESMQSTMKSGDGKVVAAIEALGEKLDKPKEEEEEKSFTTTTQDVDKSAFLSMFDSSAQEAIKARVVTAQAEYDSQIRSILAEAKTIFSVTVPNAIGYQARRIELSYGSVDASLSRYSDFFKALAGPIMMLCSLIAALAILRD